VTLLVAVLIGLAGLAMVALAILAIRDDSPQWAYKIRRPWLLLSTGLLALVVALIVNATRTSFSEQVGDFVGRGAECEQIGVLDVAGEPQDVHVCNAVSGVDLGCFAKVDGEIVDVTRQAQAATGVLRERC
jgi:hypothetical protein